MKIIDPNHLMNTINISYDTPKDIKWLVKMLKGMMLFGDANPEKDSAALIPFFHEWVNTHSPQKIIWGLQTSLEDVTSLYNRAVLWIREVEKV